MAFFSQLYEKNFIETERNLNFWIKYQKSLEDLDFKIFSSKLKVPILVPVGNRILFRGEIKHTNEMIVALGSDYFAKCSVEQAEVLRQHRIKDAKIKVAKYRSEQDFMESQYLHVTNKILEEQGEEIVEPYNENEEKIWREKHRINLKESKLKEKTESNNNTISDDELWYRLEELELQEEFENELGIQNQREGLKTETEPETETEAEVQDEGYEETNELLRKVMEKQKELERKLSDINSMEKNRSVDVETDLLRRVDEIEDIYTLEEEIYRLEDIITEQHGNINSDTDQSEDASETEEPSLKRRVSFLDEEDDATNEITFSHSDNEPTSDKYDDKIGIQKPSDIYTAFKDLFNDKPTSILKKTNYTYVPDKAVDDKTESNETIELNDVLEREEDSVTVESARPKSLFKIKREMKRLKKDQN